MISAAVGNGRNQVEAGPVFEGFEVRYVDVADAVRLRVRVGGAGPAVALLHGHPRTHTTWYAVAPVVAAAGFTVVCPDLRGYGQSTAPAARADHSQASKRAMAQDIAELMSTLGFRQFAAVGHDRGSYVAARAALDYPDRVSHLVVLDAVPIGEAFARVDARFAQLWWHWFFFAQSEKPERAINDDPERWYGAGPRRRIQMGPGNYADYRAAIGNPAVVTAMLEDYRAGLGVDRAADDTDRAHDKKIACPTLVGWSSRDDMEGLYGDVLAVWEPWTTDLSGHRFDSGHHIAEDAPAELARLVISHISPAR